MIPEWIRWWMAHYPYLVRGWAVLIIVDMAILFLVPFMPDDEEQGIESASAFGVVDDLRLEM